MLSRFALGLCASALAACSATPPGSVPGSRGAETSGSAEASPPALVRFEPAERGGPTLLPEAAPSGTLDLSGPCARLRLDRDRSFIIVATSAYHVGTDRQGPFVQGEGFRFRNGDGVRGGGGFYDHLPTLGAIAAPLPAGCGQGPFVVLHGLKPLAGPERPSAPPRPPAG